MVGLGGLEPPTSRLSGVRSNHLSYKPMLVSASGRRFRLPTPCGGDEEDRTPDPLLARQVLSQLSYTPMVLFFKAFSIVFSFSFAWKNVVGLTRLELVTSRLSGVRSNQLSYRPIYGGDEEIRTPDPLLARQVLSQLSYTPTFFLRYFHFYVVAFIFSLSYVQSTRLRSQINAPSINENLLKKELPFKLLNLTFSFFYLVLCLLLLSCITKWSYKRK